MQLDVIQDEKARPWYANGLKFTCTQCGNCCTGPAGYVWLTETEIERIAEFLGKTPEEVRRRHVRSIDGRLSLKERRNERGEYDCIFLVSQPGDDKHGKRLRGCSIYPVRPLQCRTWPFWDGVVASPRTWKIGKQRCPGMDKGRWYSQEQIEALRDAQDWPERSPGSK